MEFSNINLMLTKVNSKVKNTCFLLILCVHLNTTTTQIQDNSY